MNPAAKLGAFGVVLAVALAGGAGLGAAFGPDPDAPAATHASHESSTAETTSASSGLAVADQGYRLVAEHTTLAASADDFRFRIDGPAGIVHDFAERHTKELHLVVVSRDLAHYEHVHPVRDAAGTWSVVLGERPPGAYGVFADFQPRGGPVLTLGVDVVVPGDHQVPPRPAGRTTDRVDGFDVALAGDLDGDDSVVTVRVTRDGEAVALEPYLGANGHLVAFREGDLAYLHVHPETGDAPVGAVGFALQAPSAGRYRLFFDFRVAGVVRTADFAVDVAGPTGARDETTTSTSAHGH